MFLIFGFDGVVLQRRPKGRRAKEALREENNMASRLVTSLQTNYLTSGRMRLRSSLCSRERVNTHPTVLLLKLM